MNYIADLHIHSKYSRACSKDLELENINEWCKIKGIDVVATGDFTHPAWFSGIKKKLEPLGNGLFKLKKDIAPTVELPSVYQKDRPVYFFLATEVSCIYRKNDKTRRLHIVIFAPDLQAVKKINEALGKLGKIASDGRPILGLDAKRLAQIVFDVDDRCMIIPAHAWTPWFAIFGSKSGFDSMEECFDELADKIYAIETGLSSDPSMNRSLSALDKITLISNSDAHSLKNLGREANVFDFSESEISYDAICNAIKTGDKKKFLYTIEFYPEEGMYHYDGHRACNVCFDPEETKKQKSICPVCKKNLTVGVMNRVDELSDKNKKDIHSEKFIGYKSLVPLREIISEILKKGKETKTVEKEYFNLIEKGKNEFNVLLNLSCEELKKITDEKIALGIKRMREGQLIISPGFDGQYGTVKIFSEDEIRKNQQKKLL